MSKQKFNHSSKNIDEATGVNLDALQKKLNDVTKDNVKRSENIEIIANNFTKVELAVMFDQSFSMVQQLKEILDSSSESPLAGLLALLGQDEG